MSSKYLPKGIGIPASLPILPQNATAEQLQAALKTKKTTCTGTVSTYSCGNHDTTPTYNGAIIPVNTGDEVAMNSLVLSIVSIDGSGNGSGLIKIPMMNNGVTLKGIQVVEGGCVVAGRAELSGISASVLSEQQRSNLEKAYTALNQAIDAGIANAGTISKICTVVWQRIHKQCWINSTMARKFRKEMPKLLKK